MNNKRLEFLNGVQKLIKKIWNTEIFEITDYKEFISVRINLPEVLEEKIIEVKK
jgi:hypothetical protein